jgi:hypothetical protein
MTEATQIQQAVLAKLQQLPLAKQRAVLNFVDSLHPPSNLQAAPLPSLRQIATLSLTERHKLLQPHVSAIAEDFRTDATLTEFATLDGEDWDLADD